MEAFALSRLPFSLHQQIDLNNMSMTSSHRPKVVAMENGCHQTRHPRHVRLCCAGWRDRNGIDAGTNVVSVFL